MAEKLRGLRRRLKTVRNIEHITRAMQFVATARLQRLQKLVTSNQAYAHHLGELLDRLAATAEVSHPYLEEREIHRVALVVMAGDRGLCGAFNQQLFRVADAALARLLSPAVVLTIGARAERWARRRGLDPVAALPPLSRFGRHGPGSELGPQVRGLYDTGQVDQVQVVFEEFESALRHRPVMRQLLPLTPGNLSPPSEPGAYYEFLPPAPELLKAVLPQAVDALLSHMAAATHASEHAARMTAMTAATDNAQEMITDLTRRLNRARQTMITSEIMDVVGGANAVGAG